MCNNNYYAGTEGMLRIEGPHSDSRALNLFAFSYTVKYPLLLGPFWLLSWFGQGHQLKVILLVRHISSLFGLPMSISSLVWREWNGFCLSRGAISSHEWPAGNGTECEVNTIELSSPTSGGEQWAFLNLHNFTAVKKTVPKLRKCVFPNFRGTILDPILHRGTASFPAKERKVTIKTLD